MPSVCHSISAYGPPPGVEGATLASYDVEAGTRFSICQWCDGHRRAASVNILHSNGSEECCTVCASRVLGHATDQGDWVWDVTVEYPVLVLDVVAAGQARMRAWLATRGAKRLHSLHAA